MNDALESPVDPAVTYTLKVLSTQPGEGGREIRTVLFRRTSRGETIEISAETDAPNLLARLPDFLDAAMESQRSRRTVQRTGGPPWRFAEESRLLRWLTDGGSPGGREGAYPPQP